MATEKELEEEMERLRAQVQGLASDLEDAKTGLAAFGKATVKGAGDITKGLGSFATQVGRGDTSFKSLNSVVDIASNALSGMAKAIPYAGEALAAGIKATAEASKFMLEQLDQTTKAFNDLSRVGALTEAGMSGLQKQFIQSGLTLGTFQKQITDNAQALARFRGMAGDGADAFSEIAGNLTQGGDDSLRRLGMSADQIGESTAAFVTQQTRLGLSQGKSAAELAAGTKAYAIELDALQKVTGLSREAIQKQQDASLSEARFRANYDTLIAQGREKEAKQLMTLQTQISAIGPEAGQGVRDLLSGAGTDAAKRLMASTGGAAQGILDQVKSGSMDSTQATLALQDAMKKTASAARNNAQYVDKASSAYLDYAQQSDFINAKIVNGQLVRDRQDKQMTKGQDALTDTTVDAEKNIQKMNIEMQRLGFTFLPQASSAVDAMTKSMSKFIEFVNQKIGGGGTGAAAQNEKAAKAAYEKAMEGASFSQKYLGIGRTKEQEEAYNAYYKAQLAATQARSQGPEANNLSTPSAGVVPGKSVTIGDETRTGGDRNWRNNNPGNIEYGPFAQKMGAVGSDGRFAIFPNEEMGRKAADALLKGSAYANLNIKDAINKWAPPSENDTNAYVNAFKQAGLDPSKKYADLSPQDQQKFLDIQKRVEGGRAGTVTSGGVLGAGTLATGGVTSPPVVAGPSAPYQSTTATVQPAEQISPTPSASAQPQPIGGGTDNAILLAQLGKLDEMISIMKNQLGVQSKQLQMCS